MKTVGAATDRSIRMGKAKRRAIKHAHAAIKYKAHFNPFSSEAIRKYNLYKHHHYAALFFRRAYRNYKQGNIGKGDHHYQIAVHFAKTGKMYR